MSDSPLAEPADAIIDAVVELSDESGHSAIGFAADAIEVDAETQSLDISDAYCSPVPVSSITVTYELPAPERVADDSDNWVVPGVWGARSREEFLDAAMSTVGGVFDSQSAQAEVAAIVAFIDAQPIPEPLAWGSKVRVVVEADDPAHGGSGAYLFVRCPDEDGGPDNLPWRSNVKIGSFRFHDWEDICKIGRPVVARG